MIAMKMVTPRVSLDMHDKFDKWDLPVKGIDFYKDIFSPKSVKKCEIQALAKI